MIPCPRSRLRIWSRGTGSAVPSSVSLLISTHRLNLMPTHGIPSELSACSSPSTLWLNLVLTYEIPPEFRGGVHSFIKTAIRHRVGTEFIRSCNFAYRWRSLPRVGRHRASKPQGSSKRVLPWQVPINQLICASLERPSNRGVPSLVSTFPSSPNKP